VSSAERPEEEEARPAEAAPGASDAGSEPAAAPADEAVPRRSFLGAATACLGACAGAGVLGAVGAAVVATPLGDSAAADVWVSIGGLERFPAGEPVKVPVAGEVRDAWSRFAGRNLGNVIVVRREAGATVFSATCPHNGCDVFAEPGELVCPCHDSSFGLDGGVAKGPSPRPLDALEAEVRDGELWIRFQRFEVGTEEQRPL